MSLLNAIINFPQYQVVQLDDLYIGKNRINNIGDALEQYIIDLFAGSIKVEGERKQHLIERTFSYIGNSSNPPDMMLKDGPAIEVKKVSSHYAQIALNSSYPKAKLSVFDPKITQACRDAEKWTEKDMIYVIGVVSGNRLCSLFFLSGTLYAANAEVYEHVFQSIKDALYNQPHVTFQETKEIGRLNGVDPLKITDLRLRAMWHMMSPYKLYKEILQDEPSETCRAFFLLEKSVVDQEPMQIRSKLPVQPRELKVQNPNNLAQTIEAYFYVL